MSIITNLTVPKIVVKFKLKSWIIPLNPAGTANPENIKSPSLKFELKVFPIPVFKNICAFGICSACLSIYSFNKTMASSNPLEPNFPNNWPATIVSKVDDLDLPP